MHPQFSKTVDKLVIHGDYLTSMELLEKLVDHDTRYLVLDLDKTIHLGRNMGELLGLGADWSYNAIKQVGNYGEIYERTVAPIGIPRAGSVNDLWTRGGILYAPPIR